MSAPVAPPPPQTAWISAQAGPRAGARSVKAPLKFTTSELAYVLCLCVVATLFLRPTDLVESLQGLHVYEALIIGAFGLSLQTIALHLTRPALRQEPINVCVLGLFAAMVVSHLSNMYLYGAYESFTEFGKVLIFYLTVTTVTTTVPRLRGMLMCFALVGALMVSFCVLDFLGIHDFKFITQLVDRGDGVTDTNEVARIMRMRGTGLFEDPNDLAMVIVACGTLCLYFFNDRRAGFARHAWLIPGCVLALGLFLTRSRGGLLAGGVACLALVSTKLGKRYAIIAAVLGVTALPVVAGRQANIDLSESGTGFERVLMWREGFAEITNHRAIFGIGHNMYADIAGLVAHNSYIHTFVELGIVGGTFFFGIWYFFLLASVRYGGSGLPLRDPELKRLGPYLGACICGWMASMFSLSRCYVPPTFFLAGMGAAYVNLVSLNLYRPRLLVRWDVAHVRKLVFASGSLFVFLYLFVRVIA